MKRLVKAKFSPKTVYHKILRHFDVEKDFRKLFKYEHPPFSCFNSIKNYYLPQLPVYLPPDISNRPEFKGILDRIQCKAKSLETKGGPLAGKLTLYEFVTIGIRLGVCLHYLSYYYGDDTPAFVQRLVKAGDTIIDEDNLREDVHRFMGCVDSELMLYNDVRKYVYGFNIKVTREGLQVNVKRVEPNKMNVVIDDKRREVIECLTEPIEGCIAPLEISILNDPKKYPVYFQSHAFRQFAERTTGGVDKGVTSSIFAVVLAYISDQPELIHKGGNSYLIKACMGPLHFGYFFLTVFDDFIVLRTFLFLTMDGTPEGAKLNARLKLSKLDKDYLGIDRLTTFLYSDIVDDPVLKAILVECGCSNLFEQAKYFQTTANCELTNTAAFIHQFLSPVLPKTMCELERQG